MILGKTLFYPKKKFIMYCILTPQGNQDPFARLNCEFYSIAINYDYSVVSDHRTP